MARSESQKVQQLKTPLPVGGSVDDDHLMRAIATGDEQAAKQVVEQHLPALLAGARHMLSSQAEAEEVAQEAFLKLWQQAENWQPGRALIRTWLRRVMHNACIDRLRARRTVPFEDGYDQPVAANQQMELEEKHLRQKVRSRLFELPERQRQALTLCHFEELSQREAASVMEISEHALESLLARARRGLKAKLNDEWRALLPERDEIQPNVSKRSDNE